MRVNVRLFARLRDIAGTGELHRDVPAGATVRAVWNALARDFPEMSAYAASISSAVNAEYSRMDVVVHEGDEVAFLPPVSGGSTDRSARFSHVAVQKESSPCSTS